MAVASSRVRCIACSLLFIGATLVSGCSSTKYAYQPVEKDSLTPVGVPGSTVALGGSKDGSSLRIVPLGLRKSTGGQELFIVRFVLENHGKSVWKLDPQKQVLEVPGGISQIALPPDSSFEGSLKEVPAGAVRIWELRFALVPAAAPPDRIRVHWSIDADLSATGMAYFARKEVQDEEFYSNSTGAKKKGKRADRKNKAPLSASQGIQQRI